MARAFSIGRKESEAVHALVHGVPEALREILEAAVKVRGMQRFMSHEVIGKGTFSSGWSSGAGAMESWSEIPTNRADLHDLVP